MKNTFKKVLLGLGISLMLLGCGVVKRQQERNDYGYRELQKTTYATREKRLPTWNLNENQL